MSKRTKPPFRADHVGSLLRPAALKKAREQRAKGEITPAQLNEIEDREIEHVIRKQEEVGLQSTTDGEFRRSWWHLDFLWGLDGIEKHIMETGVAFAAVTTRNEGLKVTGKVGFSNHPMIEHFKFVAAHTKRAPKITIPAPSAAYGRPMRTPIDQKAYPKLTHCSRISARLIKRPFALLPMPAVAICSSMKSSSQCCAIRNTGRP